MEKNGQGIKSTAFLRDALADAEILLSHASEYGINIDPVYIKSIVTGKKNEQNDSWTEQDEIDFWIAFQTLSNAVKPVSIDSLRAASEPKEQRLSGINKLLGRKKKSLVERSVSWYRRFALFSMIIMLALQIYSLIGTALMAKVNSGNTRLLEIQDRMQNLSLITSANQEDKTAGLEKSNLEIEREEVDQEVGSGIQLLDDWLNFTANVFSKDTKEVSRAVLANQDLATDGPPEEEGGNNLHNIVIVQKAKSLVIILNQYILPLLYGLLGGFAFVLRELSAESKSMTYTPTSNIKYGLRIHLGALAGLVIGFLWGDLQGKSFGVVESLSPLAVAFLAGYSVDFIFRLLDSMVGSAGKKVTESSAGDQTKK